MHAAEDEQDDADLAAEVLDDLLRVGGWDIGLEREADVTEINQVKANDEEMVDRIGHRLVSAEDIDEEDASVLMQSLRDPDGERDADGEVDEVEPDGWIVHNEVPWF